MTSKVSKAGKKKQEQKKPAKPSKPLALNFDDAKRDPEPKKGSPKYPPLQTCQADLLSVYQIFVPVNDTVCGIAQAPRRQN